MASAGPAIGQSADRAGLERLEKENQELRKRLDALEAVAKKEGVLPSGEAQALPVKALSEITVSGFVTASYFYDFSTPADDSSNAYLWNRNHADFSLNKVKLVIASPPVERSGETFDAGFRTSLIWGEDAPIVNTGGVAQSFEPLREAYVEINAPVGTGLNIKAGQLISLLNWESGDGGAANPNFSQGNQWFYTGNGPATGLQLGYTFTETVDLKARVQNGLYTGPFDPGGPGKLYMASLGLKPTSKLWANLIGFGGEAAAKLDVVGGSVIGGYQFTPQFGSGFEFDYFHFDPDGGSKDDFWSAGGWLFYDFTTRLGIAFRGEYLHDSDGFGTGGLLGFPANTGGEIYGFTATLNLRPITNLKIQPEVRVDRTSVEDGFDGEDTRVIVGAGVSYLF